MVSLIGTMIVTAANFVIFRECCLPSKDRSSGQNVIVLLSKLNQADGHPQNASSCTFPFHTLNTPPR